MSPADLRSSQLLAASEPKVFRRASRNLALAKVSWLHFEADCSWADGKAACVSSGWLIECMCIQKKGRIMSGKNNVGEEEWLSAQEVIKRGGVGGAQCRIVHVPASLSCVLTVGSGEGEVGGKRGGLDCKN